MKKIKTQIKIPQSLLTAFLIIITLTACSSDDKPAESENENGGNPGTEVPDTGLFNKVIHVKNYEGSTSDANPTAPSATLYYSLEENKAVDGSFKKTKKWDLAFGGLYASFLSGNNGSNSQNNGALAGGKGGITIVEKPFNEVVDIPADSQFKTGIDLIGTDDAGSFGNGIGWYLYDFGGEVVTDGTNPQKAHVAYALGEPLKIANGKVIPARTIILKTANGNYAKIKMISVYKDVYNSAEWFKDTPHMFYTFDYVMVPAGSTKFSIK
ncbi:HmuY family protein [Flavobacterium bizetiae]|uniref:HmuY family protein n=1 Tax=Flavobacterium bizetiae TaxID=2704140 RepID=UPI0021E8C142|nr:HmuY family protein [Flavobacterium bizetiae]UTN03147.1 HmuY family protein [Flavobacterium bizetiae]